MKGKHVWRIKVRIFWPYCWSRCLAKGPNWVGVFLSLYLMINTSRMACSETSVLTRATRRNIPEDAILHSHRRENLKSYTILLCFPNWKWNRRYNVLKQHPTTKRNCNWNSTALRKMNSTVVLKHREDNGITVCVPRQTVLMVLTGKIE
jgi:hypothetical protein